jgi:Asp-tRNA(Asn)/Glu-tRNA(Gln) amidotransferase A subunit family amidase
VPAVSDPDLTALGVAAAARRIRNGTVSPVALVNACLARVRARDRAIEAWVHVDEPGAHAAALAADREAKAGTLRGGLHGIPLGIKDIIHVAAMPTRAGAPAFAHSVPSTDAIAVARLRAAGAVIVGKTHTTQFASRDPAPTRNPWNRQHTPGGSSAGSAAAVAARMVPLAVGTQTGGSVLRPAAYCGVVGYKGAYGAIPADGVIPLAWSYDHVGILARSAEDAALAFEVLSGDRARIAVPARAPRIALARELIDAAQSEVAAQVVATADALARAGATISEVKLPLSYAELRARGHVVLEAEAAAYHAEAFAGHADEYAPGIRAMVSAGRGHAATAYIAAQRARLLFRDEVMPLLAKYDALMTPVAPSTAPAGLGSTGDPSLCAVWSWTGVPAIALPSGIDGQGLPHAIQLAQATGADTHLLGVAAWCERVIGFAAAPVF